MNLSLVSNGCLHCKGDLFIDPNGEGAVCLDCCRPVTVWDLFADKTKKKGGKDYGVLGQVPEAADLVASRN